MGKFHLTIGKTIEAQTSLWVVCLLFKKEKPKKKKYLKVVDIWGDVIKCDFDGLDAECTFENLLEYFEEVKEES